MEVKMKAAVLSEVGKIKIEEREIPKIKKNEILVKIKHVGICGSDIHYYEHGRIGDFVVEKPIVLGHESAGEVVALGEEVVGFKIGDQVTLEPGYTCGKCEYCKTGRYNLCPDVVFMATPPFDGAFAEYVAYPADMAFKLPASMNTIEGALIEPLAVGIHAAKQGDAGIGKSAVILGSGCIGLVILMALKAMGVTKVYVADVIPKRLEKAAELGATEVIPADRQDAVARVMELTGNQGVDIVFEAAGNKHTIMQTAALVKRGGKIVLVGMAPESKMLFDIGRLMAKEASISTVFRYRNIYPSAIEAVEKGLITIEKIVTNIFNFNDISDAMEYSINNKSDIVKAVIEFR
jgi:L-iditol 2-dehydrogenase